MARVHQRPLITKVLQLYGPPESVFQTGPPVGKDPKIHDPPTIERPSCGRDDTFRRKLMPGRKRRMQAMYAICRFHAAVCTAERTPLPTFLPFHRVETTAPPSPTKFGSPSHQSWISLEKSNFDAKGVAGWYAPRQKGIGTISATFPHPFR